MTGPVAEPDLEHVVVQNERLSAEGLAIAPGFIYLHTHSDFTLPVNGQAESQVDQGVTTEVIGQCGFSCASVISDADIEHTSVGYIKDGAAALLDRLGDPQERARMKHNTNPMWRLVSAGRWSEIRLLRSDANPGLVGATFEEIGRSRGTDPYDAVLDLLREEGEGLHQLLWTSRSFAEDDLRLCLQQPACAVISDTLALAPYGALEDQIGSLSGYGWAARFLGTYVRDQQVLSLSEAIRKLTAVPATRLGLSNRGTLAAGQRADIVVFDAERIASRCTITAARRYAAGIAHVPVNGTPVLRDGARTDQNLGTVLRRAN